MEKNALKKKPDAIITGGIHALVMQKSLKIPENKFKIIGNNMFSNWIIPKFSKGIIRFKITRRKAHERRLKEIRKRKQK